MPNDPMMAQAIFQAVRRGLMLSGLVPQEAERVALSVQQMYQGGRLPNASAMPMKPQQTLDALYAGLGPAKGMTDPVGAILTGMEPFADNTGSRIVDAGIPQSYLSPEPGASAPALPMPEEPGMEPAPISRLSGVLRRDPSAGSLQRMDYLYGGQTPQAITSPEGVRAAGIGVGPGPQANRPGVDTAALLQRLLAALTSQQAAPENPLLSSDNYLAATRLPETPIRPSWLTRRLGMVASPPRP